MNKKLKTPAITAASSHVVSTTSEFADYKTGDLVTCLSQGEMMLYYILRWNDDVDHIETQVPLDNQLVDKIIADMNQDMLPDDPLNDDNRTPLSTDLVAYLKNGTMHAYQVKATSKQIKGQNTIERLYIEDLYWKAKHVPWSLMFTDEMNKTYVDNIKRAVRYYKADLVHDNTSKFQHLVATKKIKVDLQRKLNWKELADRYFSNNNEVSS